MRLLLDTHVVLRELEGSRTVSPAALEAIEQATDLLQRRVVRRDRSEGSDRQALCPDDLFEHVLHSGVQVLRLDARHGLAVADLPMHRDPFDRLLVAQARSEQLTIVTGDRRIAASDVSVVDAG